MALLALSVAVGPSAARLATRAASSGIESVTVAPPATVMSETPPLGPAERQWGGRNP